jgi:small ubiquitin-related modifier
MSDDASAGGAEAKPDTLNVKVVSQDGTEIFFKCKPHTNMSRLMTAYAQRQGVNLKSVRFLFDGERVREDQTPKELGLEDGDSIDVVMEQVGGGA